MKLNLEPGVNFQLFTTTLTQWGDRIKCGIRLERDTELHCLGLDSENYYTYICSGKYSGLFVSIERKNLIIDDSYINPMSFEKSRKFNTLLTKIQDK